MNNSVSTLKKASFLKWFVIFLIGVSFSFLLPSSSDTAEMGDYCLIPPYVKTDISPNILVLMDNAVIMSTPAYTLGVAYDSTETYDGLFRHDLMYTYSGNEWVPTDPGGLISGNLLNWATTSRYDLLQAILVGGKSRNRISYPNTFLSISGSWTKTYNGCVFSVNNGNVTISDEALDGLGNGTCHYLDGPPTGPVPLVSIETEVRMAGSAAGEDKTFFSRVKDVISGIADSLVPSVYAAAKPLKMPGGPSSLPDGTEGIAYGGGPGVTLTASGGSENGYTWSISAGSLPPGITISNPGPNGPGELSVTLSGTPTLAGTYNFTLRVQDSAGGSDKKDYTIEILPPSGSGLRSSPNYNVWICSGDSSNNCNVGTAPAKTGIIDEFWDEARFGFQDFNAQAGVSYPNPPAGSVCLPASPKSSFLTAVENAVPLDLNNPLVDAEYDAVEYFKTTGACDPYEDAEPCLQSFILMITSGTGADLYPDVNPKVQDDPNCEPDPDYPNLAENSCYGFVNDLRADLAGTQNIETYIVNIMGDSAANNTILEKAADAGGGNYYLATNGVEVKEKLRQALTDILKRAASGTAASVLASGEGQGANIIQAVFYPRSQRIILGGKFDTEIMWIGQLQNLWYHVDPFFIGSSIREETVHDNILDLSEDYITEMYFDSANEQTKAKRWVDANADGAKDAPLSPLSPDISFESLGNLWEAGKLLWQRDISTVAGARTIYTPLIAGGTVDPARPGLMSFTLPANTATLRPYLALPAADGADLDNYKDGDLDRDGVVDDDDASALIKYVHGEDTPTVGAVTIDWFRSRTSGLDLNDDGDTADPGEEPKVWKLGDIVNSTSAIASWIQLNTYEQIYSDTTYDKYIHDLDDNSIPKATPVYTNRGMVFAGGNDGMLHAFNLGKVQVLSSDNTPIPVSPGWVGGDYAGGERARITGSDFGKEMWAFIPKNTLPYLRYQKELDYCHLYSVDLPPYIFDASIGGAAGAVKDVASWKTVLIGGMRYGGACKNSSTVCTAANSTDLNGDGVVNDDDCVKTPALNNGYSSYFALDITDNDNPELLWEFSHESLGFSTTGPAVVRIGDAANNGKWFAVIGSGPTGPVDKATQQFLGNSDQNFKIFVLDLNKPFSGTWTLDTNYWVIDTTIPYAFAGSVGNVTNDSDLNYQDEAVYFSYVKRTAASPYSWTEGGIGRLVTGENANPATWTWSKVIEGIGPVTSSIGKLQNDSKGILWLYFGTGRYFYENGANVDDSSGQRNIFGIKEPCYTSAGYNTGCTTTESDPFAVGHLTNVTDIANVPTDSDANSATFKGWYINLDPGGNYTYLEGGSSINRSYWAERVITDTKAATTGLVFFASYKPYNNLCAFGGKTFLWATKYNTGGNAGALLKGKVIVQVSTGSIEQIDLPDAFTEAGGRKTAAFEGVPPTSQGLSILTAPPPVKRVIHIKER